MTPRWSDNPHHRRALAEMWGTYALDLLARNVADIATVAREAARAAATVLEARS